MKAIMRLACRLDFWLFSTALHAFSCGEWNRAVVEVCIEIVGAWSVLPCPMLVLHFSILTILLLVHVLKLCKLAYIS